LQNDYGEAERPAESKKEVNIMEQKVITKTKTANILVVDDETSVCRSIEKVLSRKGYHVVEALCVSSALDALQRGGERFDLIITDLMMPQVNGIELLKIAKDSWPETQVLMITGYASIASAVEATKLGAAGYIPKPFTPDELETAVEAALAGAPTEFSEPEGLPEPGIIDVDMPFDAREVAKATSPAYVEHLTRSDMTRTHVPTAAVFPDFCAKGSRNCKRFVSKGVCKQDECPIVTSERKKSEQFQVVAGRIDDPIDVDMPFSYREVAAATSEAFAAALGRSDMPVAGLWREVTPAAESPRVLIVDDEAVVVNSVRKALSRKGYRIEEVFSGVEAYNRILFEKFDMVLLDMKLPDLNGLELLTKIKKVRPDMPVVIVTGFASIDTAVEAVQRGADDYLAKPFTPDELYNFTRKTLERTAA
jgi:DNA-binding response OmpR family regulator